MLGLRWLSNPTRLVTDFGNVLVFLYNNLVRGRRGLLGRFYFLGLLAGAAYGGYKLYQSFNDDGFGHKQIQMTKKENLRVVAVKNPPKLPMEVGLVDHNRDIEFHWMEGDPLRSSDMEPSI